MIWDSSDLTIWRHDDLEPENFTTESISLCIDPDQENKWSKMFKPETTSLRKDPDPEGKWPKMVKPRTSIRLRREKHRVVLEEFRSFSQEIAEAQMLLEMIKSERIDCKPCIDALDKANESAKMFMMCSQFNDKNTQGILRNLELGKEFPFENQYKDTLDEIQALIAYVSRRITVKYQIDEARDLLKEATKTDLNLWVDNVVVAAQARRAGILLHNVFCRDKKVRNDYERCRNLLIKCNRNINEGMKLPGISVNTLKSGNVENPPLDDVTLRQFEKLLED